MDKQEVLNKLEEANDLIVEAKYIIEEIIPQYDLFALKNDKFFESTIKLIRLLSEIHFKSGVNCELPVEAVYKNLYYDYKKVCEEKKQLQKDLSQIMQDNNLDNDLTAMNIKLIHANQKIEKQKKLLDAKREKIHELREKNYLLRRQIREMNETSELTR